MNAPTPDAGRVRRLTDPAAGMASSMLATMRRELSKFRSAQAAVNKRMQEQIDELREMMNQ